MGITDSTFKKLNSTVKSAQQFTEGKEKELSEVCTAAERLVVHTAVERILTEKGKQVSNPIAKGLLGLPCKLGGLALRWNLMESLAGAIDRLLEANPAPAVELEEEPAVEEVIEEAVVEETAEEAEPIVEEAPVEAVAEEAAPEVVAEPAVPAVAIVNEENDADDDDDEDEENYEGIDMSSLEFIDVMEEPERYAEMLEQESRGEVRLVNRYRRSFRSRLIQSQGNVQEYYSILKNALLSYKGVKERGSWDLESFNKGRAKVAKINAKTKTLYLYLAIDPAELQDTKYFFEDMSAKKKYAAVPVLMKIKGERKLKHALELIEKVCGEQLALQPVKDFEAVDYTVPYEDTKSLVQQGYIKQLTATVPVEVTTPIAFF